MKKITKTIVIYVVFVVAYLILTWITPANHNPVVAQYHLSAAALRLLSLSIALPLIGIWLVAFYGYARFGEYAALVKKNKDGRHLERLAWGLGFLAYSLPAVSVISGLLNYLGEKHPSFTPAITITSHYVSLALPLIAFILISNAVQALVGSIRQRLPVVVERLAALFIISVGSIYAYLAFTNVHLPGIEHRRIYYLSDWLVITTIIAPYVFTWFLGCLAALQIYLYNQKTTGILYRRGWNFLAAGIVTIIVASISEQYLGTLSARLSHVHISVLLLIIYLILTVIAIGFSLVALGAHRLRKIEEV